MEKIISFDELMNVVAGKVAVKGQSGKESKGAAQEAYFGTRFGANLDVEALVEKCEKRLEAYQLWIANLQIIINGKREERDAAVAEKIEKKTSIFKNYSSGNLDAVIAELQKMKEAKA